MDAYFLAGLLAFDTGDVNPFPPDSEAHENWNDGWDAAADSKYFGWGNQSWSDPEGMVN